MHKRTILAAFVTVFLATCLVPDVSAALRRADRSSGARKNQEAPREVPLSPETFAHAATLDGEAGAVLSYSLPENVFKGLHSRGFDDMCVFDADGNPVPFQIRSLGDSYEQTSVSKELPYFLFQPEKADVGTPGGMDIEINASGGIVRIKGQQDVPPRPGPVSYILDIKEYLDALKSPATEEGRAISAADIRENMLQVGMAGDNSFMATVTIKTSSDLIEWRNSGKPQVLVRMRQGDAILDRDTLALSGPLERYLLLRFSDSEAPVVSFSANAVFSKTTRETRETILAGTLSDDKRTVSYTLPGRFPITAIGFDTPRTEMMAVRLTGTDDPERFYTDYANGFVYRLEKDGATLTGDPFPVTKSLHHWNLRAAGGIPFATAPGMRVYWTPRELLFLARGTGPWTLAYGRATEVQTSALPLLARGDVKPAREIAVPVLADEEGGKLAPPAESGQRREWLLWAALGLAVCFLSGVTVWLVRSMKKEG